MNARQLAQRDPAMAALMGAMPGGSDFGADFGDFGGTFEADYGDDVGADYGADYGDDVGADYGADFGAKRAARPHPAAMAKVYAKAKRGAIATRKREMMLNPNEGSTVKVEMYTFSVNIVNPATGLSPVFGTASSLSGQNTPDTWFRPKRGIINVPSVGLALVNEIKVGNISGTVGGIGDAFEYSPLAQDTGMSLPLMSPSTKASYLGAWTTFIPPGFVFGASFNLILTFRGPSTMAPRG